MANIPNLDMGFDWMLQLYRHTKSVGAKCIFLQLQLLRNIDSYYNFFSDNATINLLDERDK